MAIVQLDLEENIIKRFNSASEASREVGVSAAGISHALSGKRRSAGGFTWRYVSGKGEKTDIDLFCQGCSDQIVGKERFIVCLKCVNKAK